MVTPAGRKFLDIERADAQKDLEGLDGDVRVSGELDGWCVRRIVVMEELADGGGG